VICRCGADCAPEWYRVFVVFSECRLRREVASAGQSDKSKDWREEDHVLNCLFHT